MQIRLLISKFFDFYLIRVLLCIFTLLFFQSTVISKENENLEILSKKDVKLYSEIFQLQSKTIRNKNSKTWKNIENLKRKISNKILFGTILADKYLHPTGWRSSFQELNKWLNKYHDHPDAYRIYRLAKRRKPKKSKFPKKPTGNFLNGYGNISKDQIKPTFPLKKVHKNPRFSFQTAIKVRRAINRKNTQYVENILSHSKTNKILTNKEYRNL